MKSKKYDLSQLRGAFGAGIAYSKRSQASASVLRSQLTMLRDLLKMLHLALSARIQSPTSAEIYNLGRLIAARIVTVETCLFALDAPALKEIVQNSDLLPIIERLHLDFPALPGPQRWIDLFSAHSIPRLVAMPESA